ncbi:MAG: hypothetical protein H6550_00025 [Chitinophagales bacterium]|nr:hypothetical protein [Chitinophagales bacterium]
MEAKKTHHKEEIHISSFRQGTPRPFLLCRNFTPPPAYFTGTVSYFISTAWHCILSTFFFHRCLRKQTTPAKLTQLQKSPLPALQVVPAIWALSDCPHPNTMSRNVAKACGLIDKLKPLNDCIFTPFGWLSTKGISGVLQRLLALGEAAPLHRSRLLNPFFFA